MIDTNTAAGWCSNTHMQTHTYPTSSDAHAYACPLWFMHPGGGVSLSESKANTQVSSFVNQLPIYGCVRVSVCVCMCICVAVCAYKSVCLCVWVEVSVGNRLIITVAPSFIIFIELLLLVCASHTSSTLWVAVYSVCVCLCVCSKSCPLSPADYFCQPVLWPHFLQQEVTQLSDLSYYSQERLGESL